ncbi:LD-carboxypeptidase [Thiomonas intermedia]|uniref:LD-carboxypeptidase n=1 Tax=Thiomonas intermedia TaxID=926 RepID=UPI0009A49400|nr:LD-carboxypeptidase [Thiomonas intermedia]
MPDINPSSGQTPSRGLLRLVSPAGAVQEPARLERAEAHLQTLGFRVHMGAQALARVQRFAGTDALRLRAIHDAARSRADVIMMTRGGYGLSRLLQAIDYNLLAQAIKERRQMWVGHSDFTALQLALLAQTGAVTFSGPMASYDFGENKPDDITVDSFLDAVDGTLEAVGFVCDDAPRGLDVEGVLWGGNLAMVASLIGTPYLPRAKGVLFLEDVNEHPYCVERMFSQLLHAGVVQRQKAVLLGQFTGYKLSAHDAGYDLNSAVQWLRAKLKPHGVPVLTGLPFGHVRTKLTLPHGVRTRVLRDGQEVFLFFPHAHH